MGTKKAKKSETKITEKIKKIVPKKSEVVTPKPAKKKKSSLPAQSAKAKDNKQKDKKLGKGLKDISYLFLSESKNKDAKINGSETAKTAKKTSSASLKKKIKSKKPEVIVMDLPKKKDAAAKDDSKISPKLRSTPEKDKSQTPKKSPIMRPISELKSLRGTLKPQAKASDQEQSVSEQVVEESKYYVSPVPMPQTEKKDLYELPAGYGDNRIVIQVRDPHWLHSYWEVSEEKIKAVRAELGAALDSARRVLRIYDVTGISFNGSNANKFFDVEINDFATSWYLNVGEPGRSFCVDIGLRLPDGRFITLARSNVVTTPIDGPSWVTDEEWMVVEDDFNRLYGLSVGLGVGLSSLELRKKIKEKIRHISSGAISSPGIRSKAPGRNFWLVVNTELIVYGATEPGAQVSVQGKPINLNPDGTFSLRFALPDGEQVIPVKAISPDKVEERVITPIVKKETK